MTCKNNELYQAYRKLFQIEADSLEESSNQWEKSDLTLRQVYYLRLIDQKDRVTFSELANETHNSKPTITELIGKFIAMDCVYRERSSEDRRVYYIYLTSKGKNIARAQERNHIRFIEQTKERLTEAELDQFIKLLNKIL
ncbi:MAG: MarR family winged helix-turn-helix transcriptional regulator [Eubacteriaceae bacterium]